MKRKFIQFRLMLIAMILAFSNVSAQSILEWNFYGADGKSVTFDATRNNANLEQAVLTRGAGAPIGGGSTNSFIGRWTESEDLNEAQANNAYYEFEIVPKEDYLVSLRKIKSKIRTQENSPNTYQWMYSLDGVNFSAIGSPVTLGVTINDGAVQPEINLSEYDDLQEFGPLSGRSLILRLYAWGGTGTTGAINFGLGKSASGTTAAASSLVIEGAVFQKGLNLEYNFYGSRGTEDSFSPTLIDNNLDFKLAELVRGAGNLGLNGNGNGFSGHLTESATKEDAIANDAYYELKLKAVDGESLSLNSLNMNTRAQHYSANTYQWLYRIDEGEFQEIASPVVVPEDEIHTRDNSGANNGFDQAEIDLTVYTDLQEVESDKTVTLRLYAWGGSEPDAENLTYVNFGFGKSTTSVASLSIDVDVTGRKTNLISGWEFSTVGNEFTPNPSPIEGSFDATSNDENLKSSVLSRGPGLEVAGLFYAYAATSSVSSEKSEALDNDVYFQVDLEPKKNCELSLAGLRFKFRRLATSPSNYAWYYSVDGSNFIEAAIGELTFTGGDGIVYDPVDFSSIPELQSVKSPVQLRLYVWGATEEGRVFAIGRYPAGNTSNSLSIYGDVKYVGPSTSIQTTNKIDPLKIAINGQSLLAEINADINYTTPIYLFDITGKIVQTDNYQFINGINKISIPLNNLSSGIYFLSINGANGERNIRKFIIN